MTKQTTMAPLAALTLSISLLAVPLGTTIAEEAATAQAPAMPMMQGGQGGMMQGPGRGMGMMNPEMMKQRQAMKQAHMAKMEGHLANIEALLRELVELNKAK